MGATVYSAPEGMDAPEFGDFRREDGRFDTDAYWAACEKHEQQVAAWCRENSPSNLAGEVIRFGVADGKASYVVYTTKPLALIHLDIGDSYQIDDMMLRGMRVSDVRNLVASEKKLDELFGRRKS